MKNKTLYFYYMVDLKTFNGHTFGPITLGASWVTQLF